MSLSAALQRSFGRAALVGVVTLGCVSLEDLSSYSAGATSAGIAGRPGIAGNGGAASSIGTDGQVDGGTPSAADAGTGASNGGEAPLDPAAVDLEPQPTAPVVSPTQSCVGAGEFLGLDPDTCYLVVDDLNAWLAARSACRDWGGDLAEITTVEENELLAREVDGGLWLGATDEQDEGQMVWNSGEPVTYASWATGQPDNFEGQENCVERRAQDSLWNDAPCTTAKRALCERSD